MRRTLSALIAVVFLARFVAIAAAADYTLIAYDDRLPPPPPPAGCAENSDCDATGCNPVILQVGSPPVIYSPADDFIAHARAALGAASTDDHYAPATIYPTAAVSGNAGTFYSVPPLPFAAPSPYAACIPPANVVYGPWIPAPYQPAMACVEPMCASYPDPATGMAAISADRLDHLLQAVDHLDAAGLHGEADQVRRVSASDMKTVLAKYKSDQSELAQLRQQTQKDVARETAQPAPTVTKGDNPTRKSVAVSVQLLEINLTKLRNLGFELGQPTAVVDSRSGLMAFLDALKREGLAEVISAPKVLTRSGETAYLQIGQQVPYPKRQADGTGSIEYRTVGTELKVLPVVLEGNKLRLEVEPRLSELDHSHTIEFAGMSVPRYESREMKALLEMESGQTASFRGLNHNRVIHKVSERPVDGELSTGEKVRRAVAEDVVEEQEFELLVLVRPEILDEAKCDEQCASGKCEGCECGRCQCTNCECTHVCSSSTTLVNPFAVEPAGYCSCGDAFGTSSCSDLFKLEPISLEPGKILTPTITPQPYEIDPATFMNKPEPQPAACQNFSFFGGVLGR